MRNDAFQNDNNHHSVVVTTHERVYKKQLGVALPNVTERLSANRIL